MGGSFKNLADMVDGGGAGATGATFKGGLLSDALNAMGVRPYGYADRLGSVRPQMRPSVMGAATSVPAPAAPTGMGAPELNNPRIRQAMQGQPGMDEGIMGNPNFQQRLQRYADEQQATDQQPEWLQDLGARAYRPEAQPFQLDPINVYRSPMQAEQDFGAAPGGRTDVGTRFLYETQRAGVAPSMDLFQRFMQTGSIR